MAEGKCKSGVGILLSLGSAGTQAFKQAGESITFSFNDEDVTFSDEDSSNTYKWKVVSRVRKYGEFWLFFVNDNSQYSIVPTQALNEKMKDFIEAKVSEHGGQVS